MQSSEHRTWTSTGPEGTIAWSVNTFRCRQCRDTVAHAKVSTAKFVTLICICISRNENISLKCPQVGIYPSIHLIISFYFLTCLEQNTSTCQPIKSFCINNFTNYASQFQSYYKSYKSNIAHRNGDYRWVNELSPIWKRHTVFPKVLFILKEAHNSLDSALQRKHSSPDFGHWWPIFHLKLFALLPTNSKKDTLQKQPKQLGRSGQRPFVNFRQREKKENQIANAKHVLQNILQMIALFLADRWPQKNKASSYVGC